MLSGQQKFNFIRAEISPERNQRGKEGGTVRPHVTRARRKKKFSPRSWRVDLLLNRERTSQRVKLHQTNRKLLSRSSTEEGALTKELKALTSRKTIATPRKATSAMTIAIPAKREKSTVTTTTTYLQGQASSPTSGPVVTRSIASTTPIMRLDLLGRTREKWGMIANSNREPFPASRRMTLPRNHLVGRDSQCLHS